MKKKTLLISAMLCLCLQNSMAQKQSRLIAQSIYIYNGSKFYLIDTSQYTYFSPIRGGDLNSRYIAYDDVVTYSYDTTSSSLSKQKRTLQYFDLINHKNAAYNYNWVLGGWLESTGSTFSTSSDDTVLAKTDLNWNAPSSSWDNVNKASYTYDAARNKTSFATTIWDNASSSWKNSERFVYTYDAANNLVKTLYQTWDSGTTAWVNNFQDSFAYSSTNKVMYSGNQIWDNTTTSWKKNKRSTYSYDAADFLIDQVEAGWDNTLSTWYNVQHYTFLNDSKGNVLVFLVQSWNKTTAAWDNFRKRIYTYDSKSNVLTNIWQNWDNASSNFVNGEQLSYSYDASGNELSEFSSIWNSSDGKWDNLHKVSYTYNSYNQATQTLYETWNKAGYWNNIAEDQNFKYYYQEYSLGIGEQSKTNTTLQLFPIPANSFMNIQLQSDNVQNFTARIYDQMGRLQRQWRIENTKLYKQTIDLAPFASGTYCIEFKGNYNTETIKKSFSVIH